MVIENEEVKEEAKEGEVSVKKKIFKIGEQQNITVTEEQATKVIRRLLVFNQLFISTSATGNPQLPLTL